MLANDIGAQCGGWTIEWQGKSGNITPGTTILDAIEATATGEVRFNRFGNFESAAKRMWRLLWWVRSLMPKDAATTQTRP
jgi:hypothetical protein